MPQYGGWCYVSYGALLLKFFLHRELSDLHWLSLCLCRTLTSCRDFPKLQWPQMSSLFSPPASYMLSLCLIPASNLSYPQARYWAKLSLFQFSLRVSISKAPGPSFILVYAIWRREVQNGPLTAQGPVIDELPEPLHTTSAHRLEPQFLLSCSHY